MGGVPNVSKKSGDGPINVPPFKFKRKRKSVGAPMN
jgi:hypothetical protein